MNSPIAPKGFTSEPQKPKPEPKPVPASLREYFGSDDAAPKKFVSQMLRKPPADLATEERDLMVRDLGQSLSKRLKLFQAFTELPSSRPLIAQQLADLAEDVCRALLPVELSLPRLFPGIDLVQFRKTAVAIVSRGPKDKKTERERLTYLWLAAAWVKCSLSGPDLGEILLLLRHEKTPGITEIETELATIFVRSLGRNAVLSEVLAVYTLQRDALATSAAVEKNLREAVNRTESERDLEHDQVRTLEGKVAQLTTLIEQKTGECAHLKRDFDDQQAVARQARRALRAKFNGLLQGEISALVRDAQDAAAEPVRPHVILDRLESLGTLIKKETKWLESSE